MYLKQKNMFLLGLLRIVLESSITLLMLLLWLSDSYILDPLNASFLIFKKEFRGIINDSTLICFGKRCILVCLTYCVNFDENI